VLDQLDGACSLAAPRLEFASPGPSVTGSFQSRYRRRRVGYTLAYPPHRVPGDRLSLIIVLHGYGGDHQHALYGMTPAQAVALQIGSAVRSPAAIVTVDGGNGYWNPHPLDDSMTMVVKELIPLCQRLGLGRSPQHIGMLGISMGAYGALTIAERHPGLVAAVAAISPAIWTSYGQANAANASAFVSPAAFATGDVIAHASALTGVRVRVASGIDDPFLPGVQQFVKALPIGNTITISAGCHTEPFFYEQEPPALEFLFRHLG